MKKLVLVSERRTVYFNWMCWAVFGLCLSRAAHLAFFEKDFLNRRALQQHLQRTTVPPERGLIVDRHGRILATTVEAGDVYVRRREFNLQHAPLLASVLGISPEALVERISTRAPFVWVARQVTPDQVERIRRLGLPGVGIEATRRRVYPLGTLAGQVLGAVGVDLQGLAGVEKAYERYLSVRATIETTRRDGRGFRLRREIGSPEPFRGPMHVELTIDAALQRVAEAQLEAAVKKTKAERGLVIISEPQTGEILALAHYPFFDPNDVNQAATDRARIRAITDPFEPGSTFKPLIVAAAIEDGVISADTLLYCEHGKYHVGGRVVRDHGAHGWLKPADVIRHSSNICAAKIGERLGAERVYRALTRFGLTRLTGIDLPGETVFPLRPFGQWPRIQLVTTSFGQGVAVTPLQLASAYAALANGGVWVRPHIVRRVLGPDGRILSQHEPVAVSRVVSESTAKTITEMLEGVVQSGTGTRAQVYGFRVAGKTGTAQKVEPGTGRYSPRARIASFGGFFPAEAPRYVILVIIDTPRTATYGGLVAAPVFHEIGEYIADHYGLRPPTPPPIQPPLLAANPPLRKASVGLQDSLPGMPSLLGLSMREALQQARLAGWDVSVEGWGFVTHQEPPPGAFAAPGRKLFLRLAPPTG